MKTLNDLLHLVCEEATIPVYGKTARLRVFNLKNHKEDIALHRIARFGGKCAPFPFHEEAPYLSVLDFNGFTIEASPLSERGVPGRVKAFKEHPLAVLQSIESALERAIEAETALIRSIKTDLNDLTCHLDETVI